MSKTFAVSMVLRATLASGTSAAFKTLSQKTQDLVQDQERITGKVAGYKAALTKLRTAERGATASGADFAGAIERTRQKLLGAEKAIGRVNRKMTKYQALQRNRDRRAELGGEMMGAVGMAMSVAAPIRSAISFESSMVDVNKNVKGLDTAQDKADMAKAIRQIGRTSPMAVGGVARLVSEAGKIGMGAKKALAFARAAERVGVAFDISADTAGSSLTKIMGQLNINTDGVVKLADAMNYLGDNSKSNAANITTIMARVGGAVAGAAKGFEYDEIAALAAALDGVSPNAETAATALKNMTLAMTLGNSASKVQQDAFTELGFSSEEMAERMQTDAKGAVLDVLEALKGVDASRRAGIMESLFGRESLGAIAPLIDGVDDLRKTFRMVADDQKYLGSAQDEYERKLASTEAKLSIFKGVVNDLGISVGNVLLPPLVIAVSILGAVANAASWLVETFPLASQVILGAVGGLVALKVGGLAAGYAATFLSDGYHSARAVLNFFRPSVLATNWALLSQRALLIKNAVAAKIAALSLGRFGVVQRIAAGATKMWTAVQWALNVALSANPIGLVVAAVAAAVGFVYRLVTVWDKLVAAWKNSSGILGTITGVVGAFLGLGDDGETPSGKTVGVTKQVGESLVGHAAGSGGSLGPTSPGGFSLGPSGGGVTTVNPTINVTVNGDGQSARDLAQRIAREVQRQLTESMRQSGALYDGSGA